MFYYELHKWLLELSMSTQNHDRVKEVVDLQVEHIKELIEIRGHPAFVPGMLLQAAIEVAHVSGGSRELTAFADQLRGMADSIDVRVKRSAIRTVSTVGKPVNEG